MLDDLIHMYLGPVRHTITSPREAADGAGMIPGSAPGGRPAPLPHLHRTRQVTADVATALAQGRSCLVLTTWTTRLDKIADALRKLGHDPVVLRGGLGARQRAATLARLQPQPGGPPLLAIATGSYAGEGFDCPPLHTLFLAAPVAQKGSLLQYAGRILRPYDGKATAEVHDYHDELTGLLASSLAKRAPGYTSTPPTRSPRRTRKRSRSVTSSGSGRNGAACFRVRCGRWVL